MQVLNAEAKAREDEFVKLLAQVAACDMDRVTVALKTIAEAHAAKETTAVA